MGASYLLSSSLVPVLSNWLLKAEKIRTGSTMEARFDRFRKRFYDQLDRLMADPALLLGVYAAVADRASWRWRGEGCREKSFPRRRRINFACALTLLTARGCR